MGLGLIVSIACVALGAKIASELLKRYHWLNWVGVGSITLVAIELIGGVHTL
jgi:predicted tellurium resistance membrane protein TerC